MAASNVYPLAIAGPVEPSPAPRRCSCGARAVEVVAIGGIPGDFDRVTFSCAECSLDAERIVAVIDFLTSAGFSPVVSVRAA